MAKQIALNVSALSLAYQDNIALQSIQASFYTNELCAIIGPNGAGKSSLLKAIMGILQPLTGEIQIFGQPVVSKMSRQQREQIAYIPQRKPVDWDFPVTVHDVVAMGLTRELGLLSRLKAHHKARIAEALDKVKMSDFAQRQIGALSGGQQQRVFMARALVQNARIMLLDEPFAGVDVATEKTIFAVLQDLKAQGSAIIVVHHDLANLERYFDRALLLRGRVIAQGEVSAVMSAENIAQAYGEPLYFAHTAQMPRPQLNAEALVEASHA